MPGMNRRCFIRTAGSLAALGRSSIAAYPAFALVVDPADPVANSAPAKRAAQELEHALKPANSTVQRLANRSKPSGSVDSAVIEAALGGPRRKVVACSYRP